MGNVTVVCLGLYMLHVALADFLLILLSTFHHYSELIQMQEKRVKGSDFIS